MGFDAADIETEVSYSNIILRMPRSRYFLMKYIRKLSAFMMKGAVYSTDTH